MLDLLSTYGMLDYQFWSWLAAGLFIITVLRDVIRERSWAEG
jgi:hypothetical protein